MFLFLLEDIDEDRAEYDDRSFAIVVAARDENEARKIAGNGGPHVFPTGENYFGEEHYGEEHYLSETTATCRLIGTASGDINHSGHVVSCFQGQ